MVPDDFALELFRKNYGHMFVAIELRRGGNGETEIHATYNKPRIRLDWVPARFCRRPVRCVRVADHQSATPTPKPTSSSAALASVHGDLSAGSRSSH